MELPRGRLRAVAAGTLTLALAALGGALFTTVANAAAGCRVTYAVSSSWPGGFGANVTVTNLGDAVNGWTLTWTFGAGQTIGQLWNGTHTQNGASVTVRNAAYNGAVPPDGTTTFGFTASAGATNGAPTVTCTSP